MFNTIKGSFPKNFMKSQKFSMINNPKNFINFNKIFFSSSENKIGDLVSYEVLSEENNIGLITIKNAGKRNALNFNIISSLSQTIKKIDEDFNINKFPRVIILNTEGEVFSSGHDLKELNSFDEEKRRQTFYDFSQLMVSLNRMNPIIIAEVQGLATAAGCQLAASCDLVIASSKAKFETPGVKVGLFCSTPSVPLAKTIGNKRVLEMLLTAESIDCKKAYDWGLVNQIIEVDNLSNNDSKNKLRKHSLLYAEKINKFSYQTLSYGKKVFYEQTQQSCYDSAYKIAAEGMCRNLNFKDTKEGVQAFLEKRKPQFNK